jgi:hypothetical protein
VSCEGGDRGRQRDTSAAGALNGSRLSLLLHLLACCLREFRVCTGVCMCTMRTCVAVA